MSTAREGRAELDGQGHVARFGAEPGFNRTLIFPVVMEFNKSIVDYPSIKRSPGGASNDWRPNLQEPNNPVPLLDMKKNPPRIKASGG